MFSLEIWVIDKTIRSAALIRATFQPTTNEHKGWTRFIDALLDERLALMGRGIR